MKKYICIIMALIMAVTLAACSGNSSPAPAAVQDEVPTYRVLTEATYPPFESYNDNNELIGFDVDLMNYIAEDQGFKIEWVDMAFDSLVPALQSDQGDIIAACFVATPDRAEQVDFTSEYYNSEYALIVKADNDAIGGMEDLTPDMVVASQIGTVECDYALQLKDEGKIKDVVILDGFVTCVMQTINGDVDATLTGVITSQAYMAKFPDQIKVVGDKKVSGNGAALAVKKGNTELLNKLEESLQKLITDGTFEKLLAKWGC